MKTGVSNANTCRCESLPVITPSTVRHAPVAADSLHVSGRADELDELDRMVRRQKIKKIPQKSGRVNAPLSLLPH